jgi:hypothetical protein
VVNHREADHDGPWLLTEDLPGVRWVDPAGGAQLSVTPVGGGLIEIGGLLPAGAIAAVFPERGRVGVAPLGAEQGFPERGVAPLGAEQGLPGRGVASVGAEQAAALGDPAFPARAAVRTRVPYAPQTQVPPGMVAIEGGRRELTVRYRRRETGLYGEAPYIDEWKPLPPRLHDMATLHRAVGWGRFAIAVREVTNAEYAEFMGAPVAGDPDAPATGVDLADARAYAAAKGLRLPTEDEWQVAAEQGLLERLRPLVWNLTESEHSDGRTRFSILKGGCAFRATGSDWYLDGGPQPPEVSVKLLQLGAGLTRSPSLGFRCAADLPPLE